MKQASKTRKGNLGMLVVFLMIVVISIPFYAEAGQVQGYELEIDETATVEVAPPYSDVEASSTNMRLDGEVLSLNSENQDGSFTSVIFNRTSRNFTLTSVGGEQVRSADRIQARVEVSDNYGMVNHTDVPIPVTRGSGSSPVNVSSADYYRIVIEMDGEQGLDSPEIAVASGTLSAPPTSVRMPSSVFEVLGVAAVIIALAFYASKD